MIKNSAINPPFWAVKEIAGPFLNDFKEFVEEYRQQLIEQIEEEGFDTDEEDLEEELNARFDINELKDVIKQGLYESQDWRYCSIPKIPLKNTKAEKILKSTDVYIKSSCSSTKGSVIFKDYLEVEMRLFPCSILNEIHGADFDSIEEDFKHDFYSVIRHELIHVMHFAYEHAEIQEHIVSPTDQEDEEEYDDYYYDSDEGEEGVNEGFDYYKRHKYAPPGKKPKSLPWDTETNLKINPYSDYHNNRFEREAHPSDLALAAFKRIIKYTQAKYKTESEGLEYLKSLSPRDKGDALLTAFKYNPVTSSWITGTQTYRSLLKKENYKDFLLKATKNLNFIIDEYISRNA